MDSEDITETEEFTLPHENSISRKTFIKYLLVILAILVAIFLLFKFISLPHSGSSGKMGRTEWTVIFLVLGSLIVKYVIPIWLISELLFLIRDHRREKKSR